MCCRRAVRVFVSAQGLGTASQYDVASRGESTSVSCRPVRYKCYESAK